MMEKKGFVLFILLLMLINFVQAGENMKVNVKVVDSLHNSSENSTIEREYLNYTSESEILKSGKSGFYFFLLPLAVFLLYLLILLKKEN